MARSLRLAIRGVNPDPSPEQWQNLGEALLRGDPLADDLADWMCRGGMQTTRPVFERALESGLDSVPDAPPALSRYIEALSVRPAWVDDRLLQQGARMCHLGGLTGFQVLRNAALMGGYQASAINRALVLTGALARGANRRVAETTKWWMDVTTEGAMNPGGAGFKSTLRVRLMHALVRRRVRELPQWDFAELGEPVNQCDMLATYLGFCVVFLLGQRVMGVPIRRDEARAVMHLWRYVGWLMGLEERYLLDDEMAGRVCLYQVLLSQAPADDSSRQLGRALMDEPLQHHYPRWPGLMGRLERAKNLSICRLFLGSEGMRDVGLPVTLPWYPALSIPAVGLGYRLVRLVPGGRDWLVRHGRERQQRYLRALFGPVEPQLAGLHHG